METAVRIGEQTDGKDTICPWKQHCSSYNFPKDTAYRPHVHYSTQNKHATYNQTLNIPHKTTHALYISI